MLTGPPREWPSTKTPLFNTAALAELKDNGVVRHVGLSNVSVGQLERARDIVDIATVQNRYNVINRRHEGVLEACEEYDVGFIPYNPLSKGEFDERTEALDEVAAAHDATRQQVALAWLLERSPVVLPIPGTLNLEHLEENIAATHIDLTDEQMRRLNE